MKTIILGFLLTVGCGNYVVESGTYIDPDTELAIETDDETVKVTIQNSNLPFGYYVRHCQWDAPCGEPPVGHPKEQLSNPQR